MCWAAFRTHTSAAPLKHRQVRCLHLLPLLLPHSHECGPVEAIPIAPALGWAASTFRTHTSAAPLKQAGVFRSPVSALPFRTHTSAAPLKRIKRDQWDNQWLPSALTRVRPR